MSNFFKALSSIKHIVQPVQDYKLYYNKETGKPLYYSMDTVDENYIIVDKITYSEARYDVYVKDGKLIRHVFKDISKLTQHGNEFTCSGNDISIISKSGVNWSLRSYDN